MSASTLGGAATTSGDSTDRPRVLLVDDEAAVLDGLRRQLRGRAEVTTATSGAQALTLLAADPAYATVISDMRMPGMDGAELLRQVHERWPDTTRILLTGQADLQAAMAAVNEGRVFRFLLKPIPPEELRAVVDAGARQHELVTAERQLLEATLRGAVQALLDVLSVAHPPAFARATRVRRLVSQLVAVLDAPDAWQLEVAAMLSQLGAVSLPTETLERLNAGQALSTRDRGMLARVPTVTERLLTEIPRLEPVRAAIRCQRLRYDGHSASPRSPQGADIPLGARLLRLALDADALMSQGMRRDNVHRELGKDAGAYDPDLLVLLATLLADSPSAARSVRIEDLCPGMVIAQDILNDRGVLLIGRGSEITSALVERLRNQATATGLDGPLLVEL